MKFSKVYEPRVNEYDKSGKLGLHSLIGLIEDIGAKHSDSVGDNIFESGLKGISWVLVEWNIKINRLPDYTKELYLETWPICKKAELITKREFEIKDKDGNVYIAACEKLVLQDFNKQQLIKVTPEMLEKYVPEQELKNEFDFSKLREPESYDFEKQLNIRKTDIDFNNHVHNSYYLDYALDITENLEDVREIRILYKQPLKLGEKAIIKRKSEDGKHIVAIYKEDTLCTLVKIKTSL